MLSHVDGDRLTASKPIVYAYSDRLQEDPANGRASSIAAADLPLRATIHRRQIVGGRAKRAFDFMVSGLALIVLSPLLLVIAVLIRVTSRGPALFWSQRIGYGGEPFSMPKFRTMRCAAPVIAREQMADACSHVTPLGRILRPLSLDELPQFFTVFTGKMSLIGPRPLLVDDPGAHARLARPQALSARPGISGLAQVRGRNRLSPARKARYDAAYACKWSWRLDVLLIWQTFIYVILRKDIL